MTNLFRHWRGRFWLVIPVIAVLCVLSVSADTEELVTDIETLPTLEGTELRTQSELVGQRIKEDTSGLVDALLPKLSAPEVGDTAMAIYIWALGLTESPVIVDEVCRISKETESDLVRHNCLRAFMQVGDKSTEPCLLASLDYLSDKQERYFAFNALAELQSEAALPLTEEVLESDAADEYWRPIFVFGKMGDVAVPFLLSKVNDGNTNVRYNAINVLGQWLRTPEADSALKERFWKEKDPHIRNLILSSLERTDPDIKSLREFMKKVKSKAGDDESKEFAKESLELLETMSDNMDKLVEQKKVSPEQFDQAYAEIWESYGKAGDYDQLFISSSFEDEPRLKGLRRRILQRNSDEAFYDYEKVSDVIYMNRIWHNND
ncbi:MAG: HEAT repeat domain-containing protein [Candidatus Zixiibacteriota bacterium]|jgi:HEAT repeat protein